MTTSSDTKPNKRIAQKQAALDTTIGLMGATGMGDMHAMSASGCPRSSHQLDLTR